MTPNELKKIKKRQAKLQQQIKDLQPLRSRLHCAATGCEGCLVCHPELFEDQK